MPKKFFFTTAATYRRKPLYERERIIDWYRIHADKDGPEKDVKVRTIGQGHGQGQRQGFPVYNF